MFSLFCKVYLSFMPRTKAYNKKPTSKLDEEAFDRQFLLEILHKLKQEFIDLIDVKFRCMLEDDRREIMKQFSEEELNTKLCDLDNVLVSQSHASINLTRKQDLLNSTKSVRKGGKRLTRSSSATDEVDRISKHQPRAKSKKIEKKTRTSTRLSRSLSRSHTDSTGQNFLTPANKKTPPNVYGVVTPKCKPNTPHVLLRRPKHNEVALSFQGSPLLTAAVAPDEFANINIPLNDGSLLSLRPQKGLRLSQIPKFDMDTMRQLQTLKDHISMVLGSSQNDSY
ncbi:borealin isoform X2 [Diabrotica virgifera virgifera]|uniref:Borealin isoform X2 n=1 Tax=Diabrotica virgifera virgifera TaxID=50390 RepID=A0A6P7G4W9_DIAVI|nr:borealin isoform X2 [Diabrotica virgifera virgifera]